MLVKNLKSTTNIRFFNDFESMSQRDIDSNQITF